MSGLGLNEVEFGAAAGVATAVRVANQFVTFSTGERSFGIDIMAVREIRSWSPTTELPGQPRGATGVLDIRGSVVQVFDLRTLINGKSGGEGQAGQVVLVVALRDQEVGILVDAVSDIIFANSEDMRAAPPLGDDVHHSVISGLIKTEERLIAILDLDTLFPPPGARQVAFV
ncbi:MAG: chemotaxis protein CheW [Devosia sp.]